MYEKIINSLRERPALYAPSSAPFWDDEHISKYMLEAHLKPDADGASRQHGFIQKSVDWIAALSHPVPGAKLLDLGCGPGIYAEKFCRAGFQVTGLDFSRRSVSYAADQADLHKLDITYRYQNYLDMDYTEEFDVITLIYCDYGVLPAADRQVLLSNVYRALKKGGLFILDGFTAANYTEFTESEEIQYNEEGFWSPEPHICIKRNYPYRDTETYLEQYVVITNEDCQCYNLWNQVFSRVTIGEELGGAGFNQMEFFGDVAGKLVTDQSKTICAAARK